MGNYKSSNLGGTLVPFKVGSGLLEASAALEVSSTTGGFLSPRMTTAQRVAISTPAEGLLVFDTDFDEYYIFKSSSWKQLSGVHVGDLAYYVDGTSGSDSNSGTSWADAKKTFAFVRVTAKEIPRTIIGNLTIYVRGVVCSPDNLSNLPLKQFMVSGSIRIEGEMTAIHTGLVADTYSNTIGEMQYHALITTTSAGWTPGAFAGLFVQITAGTGAGSTYYPILDNTADTLKMIGLPDLGATSRYSILTPSEIRGALTSDPGTLITYLDEFVEIQDSNVSALYFVNLKINAEPTEPKHWVRIGDRIGSIEVFITSCTFVPVIQGLASGTLIAYNSWFNVDNYSFIETAFWSSFNMFRCCIWATSRQGYGITSGGGAQANLYECRFLEQAMAVNLFPLDGSTAIISAYNFFESCDLAVQVSSGPMLLGAVNRFLNCTVCTEVIAGTLSIEPTVPPITSGCTTEISLADGQTFLFSQVGTVRMSNAASGASVVAFDFATYRFSALSEYDNTASGLTATRYQTAIDELAAHDSAEAITAPLNIYVDGTSGDDSADGLTWGTAKKTCGFLVAGEADALPRVINAAVVITVRGPLRARSATVPPLKLFGFTGSGSLKVQGELTAEETFTASTYDNGITNRGSLQWLTDGTKSWTPGEWRRHFVDIGAADMYPVRTNDATTLNLSVIRSVTGTPSGTIYSAPEVLSELVTNPGVKYDFDAFLRPISIELCDLNIEVSQLWFDEYFETISSSMYVAYNKKSSAVYRVSMGQFGAYFNEDFSIQVFYVNLANYGWCSVFGKGYVQYGVIDSTDSTGYGIYTFDPANLDVYRLWIGNQVTGLWISSKVFLNIQDHIYFKDCTDGIVLIGGAVYGETVLSGYLARFDNVTRGIVGQGRISKVDGLSFIGWDVDDEVVFSDNDSGTFAALTANTLQSRQSLAVMTLDADYRPILLDEYDNTTSGLTATRYQTAIDELAADIADGVDYQQVITVAKSGGHYTLPSSAVAAILDATSSKRYAVHIYPGEYTDNIVMKDYVDLVGIGPPRAVVIKSSTGTVVTMSNSARSDLRNITVSRTSTVNDEHAVEVSAGTHLIYDCVVEQTSTGAFGCLIDVTGSGLVQCNTGQLSLVQSGAASGSGNTNALVHTAGATGLLLRGINAYLEIGDTSDRAVAFFEESTATGLVTWQDCSIDVNVNVAAYASVAAAMELRTATLDKNLLSTRIRVRNSVSVSGTGKAFILASPAGGAYMKAANNVIDVTGFALNYLADNATGDTLVSEFNSINAANGSLGLGTISNDSGARLYHGIYARSTVPGANCLPTHITTTTFTLGATANPIRYYYRGVNVIVSADKTATLDDGAGGSTAGIYYVYFSRATGTILATKAFPGIIETSDPIIASVTWNGSNYGLVNDERHAYDRNHRWHQWAHFTVGARYYSGFDFVPTGTGLAATFTMSGGDLYDEDLPFTAPASTGYPTAHTIRTWYQTGALTYAFDNVPVTTPFRAGAAGRPTYVNATGYVLTEATSAVNRYFNFFIYATTDLHTPIYCFVETLPAGVAATNGYTSASAARAVTFPSLSGLGLSPELRPLYRLVVRADGAVQALISQDDYRRVTSLPSSGGTTSTTASAVTFVPVGSIAATNVQLALEEVDTEKAPLASPTFTGTVTTPALKVTTGAVLNHVFTSAADGTGSWAAPAVPATITVADTADTTCYVSLFEEATGNLGPKTDEALLYNASTGALSCTLFTANTITANTGVVPDVNDGAYLGTTALSWSDLFLASGGVINWANGNVTLTHATGNLSVAGATVFIGTTTGFSVNGTTNNYMLQVSGADSAPTYIGIVQESAAIQTRFNGLRCNGSIAVKTAVANNEVLLATNGLGWDGGITPTYVNAATIQFVVDGTVAEDSVPGRIAFFTRLVGNTDPSTVERMRIANDGVITSYVGIVPDADDGAYLGTTSLGWSDLFLASGGVINWANGNVTITHATGQLSTNAGYFYIGLTVAPTVIGVPSTRRFIVSGDGATSGLAAEVSADVGRLEVYRCNNTLASKTAVASGEGIGALNFYGWDGGVTPSYILACQIRGEVDGAVAEDYVPGRLTFYTRLVSGANAEKARLTNDGNWLVGTTDNDGTPATGRIVAQASTNDGTTNIFVGRDSDAANVASLDSNGIWTASGLALGSGSITMTGSLGATGARLTKGWFADLEVTNAIVADAGVVPDANDGAYLGTTALGWSDLFLASGGIINWDNGNYTLTHATGTLQTSGSFGIGTAPSYRLHVVSATGSAAWLTSVDTATTVGTASGTLNLQNSNSTTNNLTTIVFRDAVGATGGIYMQNTDQTNHYGVLNFVMRGADGWLTRMQIGNDGLVTFATGIVPDANDGAYLGTTALGWSDLFLASGGVINWANGNIKITQLANELDVLAGAGTSGGTDAPIWRLQTPNYGAAVLFGRITFNSTAGASAYIDYGAEIRGIAYSGVNQSEMTFYTSDGGGVSSEKVRLTYNGNLLVGTSDNDGTPATGRLVVQGSTADGSTNIFVGRDSGNANVASLDSNGIWTAAGLALGAGDITMTGSLGVTGSRLTKGWFTDLEVTNAIAGSITGNAATVTVAAETSDTSCYLGFFTATSGSLAAKINTALTVNASTAYLGATGMTITGNGSGSTAQVVNVMYGTGDPGSTAGIPYGTIYVKHEA